MPNILKDLVLDEVSLVDVPANPLASVPLFKRHTGKDMNEGKTNEDLVKALAEKEDLAKQVGDLTTKVEELTKALEDKEAVEKADDVIEVDGEKISKSTIPAPILKKLEDIQKAQEVAALQKKADELIPNFKGSAESRAALVKSVGDDAEIIAMLVAADKLFASMFEELGKKDAPDAMLDPYEKLTKMARELAGKESITFEKAYAKVIATDEGKALYKETLAK